MLNRANWIKVAGLLLALSLATEGALRYLGLGDPVLIQADPFCGYILKPGQSVKRFFRETRTNSQGMRSAEFAPQKPAGAIRLLFLGDSLTYGTSRVDQSAIFTELLHRDLEQRLARSIEVLNISASAWGIGNELAYVRSRGTFGSDPVVLILNNGDLSQPFSTAAAAVSEDLPLRRPGSATGELFSRIAFRGTSDGGTSAAGTNAESGPVVDENLAHLTELHAIATGANARMLIVFAPFPRDIPRGARTSLPPCLIQWSQEQQVPLLDLTPNEVTFPASQITLDGLHFNTEGHRIVAAAVLPTLLAMTASATQ